MSDKGPECPLTLDPLVLDPLTLDPFGPGPTPPFVPAGSPFGVGSTFGLPRYPLSPRGIPPAFDPFAAPLLFPLFLRGPPSLSFWSSRSCQGWVVFWGEDLQKHRAIGSRHQTYSSGTVLQLIHNSDTVAVQQHSTMMNSKGTHGQCSLARLRQNLIVQPRTGEAGSEVSVALRRVDCAIEQLPCQIQDL